MRTVRDIEERGRVVYTAILDSSNLSKVGADVRQKRWRRGVRGFERRPCKTLTRTVQDWCDLLVELQSLQRHPNL